MKTCFICEKNGVGEKQPLLVCKWCADILRKLIMERKQPQKQDIREDLIFNLYHGLKEATELFKSTRKETLHTQRWERILDKTHKWQIENPEP